MPILTDVERLARWLLAKSDVEAAVRLPLPPEYMAYVSRCWPHFTDPDLYRAAYAAGGPIEIANRSAWHEIPKRRQYQWLRQQLWDRPEVKRIIDFGSSRGFYAIHLARELGDRHEWLCIDIEESVVRAGRETAESHGLKNVSFLTGDETALAAQTGWDAVVMTEVLEHVRDLSTVLDAAQTAAPNGLAIITTPWGPHEYQTWIRHPELHRAHFRELKSVDWREIAGDKADFTSHTTLVGNDPVLGMAMGQVFVTFRFDGQEFGVRDFGRVLSYSNPIPVGLPW